MVNRRTPLGRCTLALVAGLLALAPRESAAAEVPATEAPATEAPVAPQQRDVEQGPRALGVYGQVVGRWDALFSEAGNTNAFTLDRAELGASLLLSPAAGFQLTLETTRAAGTGGVLGVSGDSIIARLRHGFAFYRFGRHAGRPGAAEPGTLRLGLVPDAWQEAVQADFGLRGFAPILAVRAGVLSPSDLGVSARYRAGWVTLRLALTNGEGRDQVERNPGKNLSAVVTVTPWETGAGEPAGRFSVHLGFRDGSIGPGSVRDHRVFGAAVLLHPRGQAGVSGFVALGVDGQVGRVAAAGSAWLMAPIWRGRVGLFARQDEVRAQLDTPDAAWSTTAAGAYVDLFRGPEDRNSVTAPRRFRLFVGWQRARFGERSGPVAGAPVAARGDHLAITLEAIDLSRQQSQGRPRR